MSLTDATDIARMMCYAVEISFEFAITQSAAVFDCQ